MEKQIKLLDCTLRDGAYITASKFGKNVIKGIINNLHNAGIEMIEVGWLKDSLHEENSTYFHTVEDIIPYLPEDRNPNVEFLTMIDYGRYDFSNLSKFNGKSITSIRLVFPKEKFEEAVEYSQIIKNNGYKLYLQAANTQSYSDLELIQLAEKVNKVMPESLSIVDTFGVMYQSDLNRIFMILDNNLDKSIKLGFHSHNNLQLSFALSIEQIKLGRLTNRAIVIDSSLCGMGRGAGNTCTELITNYLNTKNNSNYDINLIMDTIDIYMPKFITDYEWGYNIPYCIAGQLGSHVNNIAYLQNTHKVNYRTLKIVLESLPKNQRKLYNYDILEQAYVNYLNKEVDDTKCLNQLKSKIKDKNILLIAPGKTIDLEREKIDNFIKENKPITLGINSISQNFAYDSLFFTNEVRYEYAKNQNPNIFNNTPKILTSNIKMVSESKEEYIINYNTLMKLGWRYFDNSTIMAIRLMAKLGAKSINLAGFDGYNLDNQCSYSDIILQTNLSSEEKMQLNEDIKSMLKDFVAKNKFTTKIKFITSSQFQTILESTDIAYV